MPKQTLNINRFEGGLNTDTDPRDLKDNEFAELKGVYIDKPGRIRTAGSVAQYDSSGIAALSRNSTPTGYGLFQFGTDYDWEGVYTGSEKFTVLTDDYLIKINDDSWETGDEQGVHADDAGSSVSTLQLHTSSMGVDVNNSFYYNNNALRCSFSKSISSSGESKWIGYIDNTYYKGNAEASSLGNHGGNKDFTKTGWFIFDQFIAPPTQIFIDSSSNNIDDSTDANHWDEIDAANLISVSYAQSDGGSPMESGISEALKSIWIFGISYIYDGIHSELQGMKGVNHQFAQESSIEVLKDNHLDTTASEPLDFSEYTQAAIIQVHFKAGSSYGDNTNGQKIGMNSRVTGMRFYIKEHEGEGFQDYDKKEPTKPWLRFAEADLTLGVWTNFTVPSGDEAEMGLIMNRIVSVNNIRGNTYDDNGFTDDTQAGAISSGTTITMDGANANILVGMGVTGGTIPDDTLITTVASASADPQVFVISNALSGSLSGGTTLTFSQGGAELMTITHESNATDTDPTANGIALIELPSESYYSLNGYKSEHIIDCKYSTATVLNHSAYIGDIYDETNSKYYGDRVIRTPKFKLDTFSTDFFVDIVPGDGDNIVKLENYADRLMVFKHNKLFIINVSQESMFIEQELNGMGVAFPGQVAKTDYGVAWANKNGAYIFNGTKVQNLTDNKIKTTWDAFYTETIDVATEYIDHDYTQVGFDPKSKHIVFLKSNNTGHGDCLIYDMKIAGWIYLDSFFTDGEDKTNFLTSVDNKLIIHENDSNDYILEYSDASATVASGAFSIKTKDYDFGNPHVRKKIYRVYVTYKCNSDSYVKVRYDTNGATDFDLDFQAGTNYASNTLDSTSNAWARAELKPDTSSEANGIYSFALHFISTGTVPATFEINDITIIYRVKGVK